MSTVKMVSGLLCRKSADLMGRFFGPADIPAFDREHYFKQTLVVPPDFDLLLKEVQPSTSPVLHIIRGQSRTGKTWCSVNLAKYLLDRAEVNAVISCGEDSHLIFGSDTSIGSAIRILVEQIEQARSTLGNSVKLCILMDDFLGGTFPRFIGTAEDAELVRACLSGTCEDNPILGALKDVPSTVIMSARSVLLLITRVLCGLSPYSSPSPNVKIHDFRGGGNYEAASRRDRQFLDQVLIANLNYEQKHGTELSLPVMAAFAPSQSDYENRIDEDRVARTVFQSDLEAIAFFIREPEVNDESVNEDQTEQIKSLMQAYVFSLAPGLSFPLPRPDLWPHGERFSREFRIALGLQPEESGDLAYRVPNRFYLRAIRQHLQNELNVKTISGSIAQLRKWNWLADEDARVLARGILEWVLEILSFGADSHQGLTGVMLEYANLNYHTIRTMLFQKLYSQGVTDALLFWEMGILAAAIGDTSSNEMPRISDKERPGIASAIAWGIHRFRNLNVSTSPVSQNILDSFADYFRGQLDGTLQEEQPLVSATYSNMARWIAQTTENGTNGYYSHELAAINNPQENIGAHAHLRRELNMVWEDVLVWADSSLSNVNTLPDVRQFVTALENDIIHPNNYKWLRANRLFSLAWHNEWLEGENTEFRTCLRSWLEKTLTLSIESLLIEEDKCLIEWNLAYHWYHIVAQWSVWTRDWCFSFDPVKHEGNRGPFGCRKLENNTLIGDILRVSLDHGLERCRPELIRNAWFLWAIRSSKQIPKCSVGPSQLLKQLRIDTSVDPAILRHVLSAIFELSRQGFLETLPDLATKDKAHPRQVARELNSECRKFVVGVWKNLPAVFETAFAEYIAELETLLHLELIPKDFFQIAPNDWLTDEFLGQKFMKHW